MFGRQDFTCIASGIGRFTHSRKTFSTALETLQSGTVCDYSTLKVNKQQKTRLEKDIIQPQSTKLRLYVLSTLRSSLFPAAVFYFSPLHHFVFFSDVILRQGPLHLKLTLRRVLLDKMRRREEEEEVKGCMWFIRTGPAQGEPNRTEKACQLRTDSQHGAKQRNESLLFPVF